MATLDPAPWKLPRLRIDVEGAWFHEDAEVTHPGILDNLRDSLRVDAAGYYVQVGSARVPVEVADAPFVVVRLEVEDGRAWVTLGDLSREALRLETVRLGPGEIPYCAVKDGRFQARFSRAAAWSLLQHAEPDDTGGRLIVALGAERREIPRSSRP